MHAWMKILPHEAPSRGMGNVSKPGWQSCCQRELRSTKRWRQSAVCWMLEWENEGDFCQTFSSSTSQLPASPYPGLYAFYMLSYYPWNCPYACQATYSNLKVIKGHPFHSNALTFTNKECALTSLVIHLLSDHLFHPFTDTQIVSDKWDLKFPSV